MADRLYQGFKDHSLGDEESDAVEAMLYKSFYLSDTAVFKMARYIKVRLLLIFDCLVLILILVLISISVACIYSRWRICCVFIGYTVQIRRPSKQIWRFVCHPGRWIELASPDTRLSCLGILRHAFSTTCLWPLLMVNNQSLNPHLM